MRGKQARIPKGVKRHHELRISRDGEVYAVTVQGGQFAPKPREIVPRIDEAYRPIPLRIVRWRENKAASLQLTDKDLRAWWRDRWKIWVRNAKKHHNTDLPPTMPLEVAYDKLHNLLALAYILTQPLKSSSCMPKEVVLCTDLQSFEALTGEPDSGCAARYVPEDNTVYVAPLATWVLLGVAASPPAPLHRAFGECAALLCHELAHGHHYSLSDVLSEGKHRDKLVKLYDRWAQMGIVEKDNEVHWKAFKFIAYRGVRFDEGIATLSARLSLMAFSNIMRQEYALPSSPPRYIEDMDEALSLIANAADKPREVARALIKAMRGSNIEFMPTFLLEIAEVYGVPLNALRHLFDLGAERLMYMPLSHYVPLMRELGRLHARGVTIDREKFAEVFQRILKGKWQPSLPTMFEALDHLWNVYMEQLLVRRRTDLPSRVKVNPDGTIEPASAEEITAEDEESVEIPFIDPQHRVDPSLVCWEDDIEYIHMDDEEDLQRAQRMWEEEWAAAGESGEAPPFQDVHEKVRCLLTIIHRLTKVIKGDEPCDTYLCLDGESYRFLTGDDEEFTRGAYVDDAAIMNSEEAWRLHRYVATGDRSSILYHAEVYVHELMHTRHSDMVLSDYTEGDLAELFASAYDGIFTYEELLQDEELLDDLSVIAVCGCVLTEGVATLGSDLVTSFIAERIFGAGGGLTDVVDSYRDRADCIAALLASVADSPTEVHQMTNLIFDLFAVPSENILSTMLCRLGKMYGLTHKHLRQLMKDEHVRRFIVKQCDSIAYSRSTASAWRIVHFMREAGRLAREGAFTTQKLRWLTHYVKNAEVPRLPILWAYNKLQQAYAARALKALAPRK